MSPAPSFIPCVCVFITHLHGSVMELDCHGNSHNKAAADENQMFWSTVEPVAMETVATTVQLMAKRVLMSSDALSLTHCVKKNNNVPYCCSHTQTHSCGVSCDRLSFWVWHHVCRLQQGVFARCLMTSVHLTDITAQCCSALRDWSVEHDLYAARVCVCVCTSGCVVCWCYSEL